MSLIEDLNWRYATKRMNGKDISQEDLDTILETIRLAPTSMGLQAYKVFIITNKELIDKIQKEAAPRQLMLKGCSYLLVFTAYTKVTNEIVDEYVSRMANIRNVALESLADYRSRFGKLIAMSDSEKINWTSRQVYIAMAYASVAAAKLNIDSTPIEGFDCSILDEILGLRQQNLTSVLMFPLGYRDEENDYLIKQKKVRKDNNDLFIKL